MTLTLTRDETRMATDPSAFFCDNCVSTYEVQRLQPKDPPPADMVKVMEAIALCRHCRILFAPAHQAELPDELEPAPIYARVVAGEPEPEPERRPADPEEAEEDELATGEPEGEGTTGTGEGSSTHATREDPSPERRPRGEAANNSTGVDASASLATSEKDETP